MNRLRAFALATTLSLHLFVLWWVLAGAPGFGSGRTAAPQRRSEPESRRPARPLASTQVLAEPERGRPAIRFGGDAPRAAQPAERSPRDAEWRSAYNAGRGFETRRRQWVAREYRRLYGDDIAALMALPMRDAWPRLESLALDGDKTAAEALAQLAMNCVVPPAAAPDPGVTSMLVRGTERMDSAFIQGAYDAEFETQQRERAECDAPGLGFPRLRTLVEKRLGTVPAGISGDANSANWYLISQSFRQTFGEQDGGETPDTIEDLGRRLSAPNGPTSQADIDALLAAVEHDPKALDILAFCFIHGCNGIDALPPAERLSWSLRAARNGDHHAIQDVIEQTQGSDPVTAHAWAGFEQALLVAGCDPMPNAGMISLLAQARARIGATLNPAQRALAEQRTSELMERYGGRAMGIRNCVPAR